MRDSENREIIEFIIRDNKTIEATHHYINHASFDKQNIIATNIKKVETSSEDKFDKKIGMIMACLKVLGFSRRIRNKILDILLEG